ncbi:MarR family winged helix-turn-helix transcriptional regulator [Conexibacter woesei]|uniref:Transcriptional regulator, MarR family n=1 Tax=Conexibacter woesei (strain DSM 14684 / CCUG 47730 / CIP 108061 / JCM 11494 / NBRC 100937 / ID131577) TaxID=469383 RepID=D3F2I5_CONWI|nr:MarR family transcriptional regulator [Conexibacter woesei]ADB52251.1 transcriptional regulator, MarR family [Conexibacter woesei DSM 14684]
MSITDRPEPADAATAETDGQRCLAADLGWLLAKASFSLNVEIGRAFIPLGVTPRAYHVLEAAADGRRSQSDLVDLVGVDKTTMVQTIDALEAAGLAERRPCEHDRRARIVVVTPLGHEKIAEGRATVHRVQSEVLATLPRRTAEAFLEGLQQLVDQRLTEPMECERTIRRARQRR